MPKFTIVWELLKKWKTIIFIKPYCTFQKQYKLILNICRPEQIKFSV